MDHHESVAGEDPGAPAEDEPPMNAIRLFLLSVLGPESLLFWDSSRLPDYDR